MTTIPQTTSNSSPEAGPAEQGMAEQPVRLCNDDVEVVIAPELGAKVVTLRNRHTGRDWFSGGTAPKLFANKPGDPFSSSPLCGWDECFPTVSPCTWRGRELADHGEVWSVPWQVEQLSVNAIRTAVDLRAPCVRLSRTLSLEGHELLASYSLTNLSAQAEEFVWAMHPLIVPQTGDRVCVAPEAAAQLSDSQWLITLDFNGRHPACTKVFLARIAEGRAAVVNDLTGDQLTFEWSTSENDTLGIWLTRGGWHGCHHLALEPTNAAADSLADAAGQGHCGLIASGETKTWAVRLRIEP